jgi:adenosine kinase
MKKILVIGSLAYDYIMNFDDRFVNHIIPDKIHVLNVSFTAKKLSKEFGGTAGNIAYNLSLLGEKPAIIASAGSDFNDYKPWLEKNDINTRFIKTLPNQFTASAHIITDRDDNQITAFFGGAMLCNNFSIKHIIQEMAPNLAIVAPDCKEGMLLHAKELKEFKIPYIFDPGQAMPVFNKKKLISLITGSKAAIFNDYEIQLFTQKTGLSIDKIANLTEYLIITLGGKGSKIFYKNKKYKIPAAKPKNESDPTGAGDAYRAGITKGLLYGLPPDVIGRIGALAAVYTVEKYGTQTHKYSTNDFLKRYRENFRKEKSLKKIFD